MHSGQNSQWGGENKHQLMNPKCMTSVLERDMAEYRKPQTIQVDIGPEFISKDVDLWAYWNRVKLDFSR